MEYNVHSSSWNQFDLDTKDLHYGYPREIKPLRSAKVSRLSREDENRRGDPEAVVSFLKSIAGNGSPSLDFSRRGQEGA